MLLQLTTQCKDLGALLLRYGIQLKHELSCMEESLRACLSSRDFLQRLPQFLRCVLDLDQNSDLQTEWRRQKGTII